tara:strand:+ start:38067 stop:38324 length:258 start_codon:yes stop_codon:yes gene_type:complete
MVPRSCVPLYTQGRARFVRTEPVRKRVLALAQGVVVQGVEKIVNNLGVRALGDRFVRAFPVMRGGEREDREGLEEGTERRGGRGR